MVCDVRCVMCLPCSPGQLWALVWPFRQPRPSAVGRLCGELYSQACSTSKTYSGDAGTLSGLLLVERGWNKTGFMNFVCVGESESGTLGRSICSQLHFFQGSLTEGRSSQVPLIVILSLMIPGGKEVPYVCFTFFNFNFIKSFLLCCVASCVLICR